MYLFNFMHIQQIFPNRHFLSLFITLLFYNNFRLFW